MESKVVCKTMLYEYRNLEKYCDNVDGQLWRCGMKSRNINVYEAVDRLVKLNNEKIAYCNIKVIIDEAFEALPEKYELKAYYIDGVEFAKLEAETGIQAKSLFRRLEKQRNALCLNILSRYDFDYLFGLISDSRILLSRYRQLHNAELLGNFAGFKKG